ncbi:MAG: 3-hydroxyacyl-CoA dehydrogenase [Proteobacteria bacterium]|nr:3-hydroxyacyl-CoA dehydrogenase [Pseudomonadota bacterium]
MKIDDIRKVLILGSGTMGQQIGILCAFHGYDVVLYDLKQEILDNAFERIKRKAPKLAITYQFNAEQTQKALSRISMSTNPEEAAMNVDIISESVPEDPKLKGKIFAQFHAICDKNTIFTTNTSSLLPSQFADACGRPEKLCALHFHDTTMTKVVDVMPHPGTSQETIELVTDFAERIGQIAIVLNKEHNGYVFNNMFMALLDSALALASKNVTSVMEIDRAWMGVMHTMIGPFGLMDSVGIDTVYKITNYWAELLDHPQAKANAAFLKVYVDQGKLGLKTGEGFYTYPAPDYAKPTFVSGK